MATDKPKVIQLTCRSCKKSFETDVRPLLKYFDKEVSIPCPICQTGVKTLVNKELFINGEGNSDSTKIYVRNESYWVEESSGKLKSLSTIQLLPLMEGINCIGRKPDAQDGYNLIKVDTEDRLLSRSHCLIGVESKDGKWAYSIKDNKSSNGTYLNNEKLHEYDEVFLKNGDLIGIGTISFRFIVDSIG
jgi:hypothetical protein